jgi:hypothetical protein
VDLSIKYITDLWISVIFLNFRFIDSFLNLLDKVTTVGGNRGDDLGRTRRWESACQYTYSVAIPEDWELVAKETPRRTSAILISEQRELRLCAIATATEMI